MKRYRFEVFARSDLSFVGFAEASEPDIYIDALVSSDSKVACPGLFTASRGDFAQIRIDGKVYFTSPARMKYEEGIELLQHNDGVITYTVWLNRTESGIDYKVHSLEKYRDLTTGGDYTVELDGETLHYSELYDIMNI